MQNFSYLLDVVIHPDLHQLQGRVKIHHPPEGYFYLNNDLTIHRITANGSSLPFHRIPDERLPYAVGSAVMVDGEAQDDLVVEYTGILDQVVSDVNMIHEDLIELALYSTWFPLFKSQALFEFELHVDLPTSYIITGNGTCLEKQEIGERSVSKWKSSTPCFDIVVIASPYLQRLADEQLGTQIEFYFRNTPSDYITVKKSRLMKALGRLTDYYGDPKRKGLLRFVHSPRGGWGYERDPLIIVSEEYTLRQLDKEFGQGFDFHYSAHELAHLWWSIADVSTPDDWINEGLAEYSAFRLSEEIFGPELADHLVKQYRAHALQSLTKTAIAETMDTSEDRYVNRYEKMALIYIEARRRYGGEKLDGVFKAMHSQFAGTREATTGQFLQEVGKQIDPGAENYFRSALYQREWTDPQKLP